MAITGGTLADGQLPGSTGDLLTVASATVDHVTHIILTNTTGGAITVNLYVKRGSTARRIIDKDKSLAAGSSYWVPITTALRLSAGDKIQGDASAGSSIDYLISGGVES